MPVKKLTARFVETVKGNGVERIDYRDAGCPGLELRITPSGGKSWSLLYRTEKGRGAARRRLALGDFPAVDLEDARTVARKHIGAIAGGADPAAAQRRVSDRVTVKEMGEAYLEKHAKKNKRSWRDDERKLIADIYPEIGKLRPRDVDRSHIQAIMDRVVNRGSPIQANRTFAVLSAMFRWGIGSYVDASPCYAFRKPSKERARERVLTRTELPVVWQHIERGRVDLDSGKSIAMSEPLQLAAKLLMLLGQRSSEVTQARRDELDLKAGLWVIPAGRSKNGRSHRLPLPAASVALFQRAIDGADDTYEALRKRYQNVERSPYVFPSPFGQDGRRWGTKPIGHTALGHALKRVLAASEVQDVTPHDFRRTAATYMAEMGVPEVHISAVLNHARAGVTGRHYDQYQYQKEMRQALEAWEAMLLGVVASQENDPAVLNIGGQR